MQVFGLILVSILFATSSLYGQKKKVIVSGLEGERIEYRKIVKGKEEAITVGRNLLQDLYSLSYLSASIDSLVEKETEFKFYLNKGSTYKWISLSNGNLDQEAISNIDLSNRLFLNRPFNSNQLNQLFDRAIDYYENVGYPFASIELDSINIDELNQLSASLRLEKNEFYKLDSVIIKGNSDINESYLLHYLDLKIGEPYNEESIKNIKTRIQEIPFVSESEESKVQFFEEGVKIIITLKKRNASRFDGVLGLLTSEEDGSIELTGDVNLNLINAFNRGEQIGLNWRKLKGQSQDLDLKFLYPFFLNTPFGIDFNFKLFKRDTTFLDLTTRLGINYNLRRGEFVTVFLENKTSSLLSRNSFIDQNINSIPALGDVTINSFGLAYDLNRTDYRYNPTKGIILGTSFSVGLKNLEKISALEEENPSIYKDVQLKTTQYQGILKLNYFVPLSGRSTILIGNQSAGLYSENIYQNELLRIGGLKILRGFDEESINASAYSIFTLEYRFLLDRNSYFSLFSDGGFYENNVDGYISDTPFGVGAGISFETNAGIFTFNYAVGKQFDNAIEFQAAKIHFGFVNFF